MEKVRQYFMERNASFIADRMMEFTTSGATVDLAAEQLGCAPALIAKSLSFVLKKPLSKSENNLIQRQRQLEQSGPGASPATAAVDASRSVIVVVVAGDAKVSNQKYKAKFGCPMKMLKREEVAPMVGHLPGAVCPFAVQDDVMVYLDVSLQRFGTVFPACGSDHSGVAISLDELQQYSKNFVEWVDLCDGWQAEAGDTGEAGRSAAATEVKA